MSLWSASSCLSPQIVLTEFLTSSSSFIRSSGSGSRVETKETYEDTREPKSPSRRPGSERRGRGAAPPTAPAASRDCADDRGADARAVLREDELQLARARGLQQLLEALLHALLEEGVLLEDGAVDRDGARAALPGVLEQRADGGGGEARRARRHAVAATRSRWRGPRWPRARGA